MRGESIRVPAGFGGLSVGGAPRYLIRDRDRVYAPAFRTCVEGMGIEDVLTAPRSPWQNPFAERVTGTSGVRPERLVQ